MTEAFILKKIKETEDNIRNWYVDDNETEEESSYYLNLEKKYLRFLKAKIGDFGNKRVDRILSEIECFDTEKIDNFNDYISRNSFGSNKYCLDGTF